jgi:hypothetical protein
MAYLTTWIIPLALARGYWAITHNTPTTIILTLTTTIAMLYAYTKYTGRKTGHKK